MLLTLVRLAGFTLAALFLRLLRLFAAGFSSIS
jgi:hypothetical protein